MVLLLDKTFEARRNTVYRVTSSLMSELPQLSLAEARTKVAGVDGTCRRRTVWNERCEDFEFCSVGTIGELQLLLFYPFVVMGAKYSKVATCSNPYYELKPAKFPLQELDITTPHGEFCGTFQPPGGTCTRSLFLGVVQHPGVQQSDSPGAILATLGPYSPSGSRL